MQSLQFIYPEITLAIFAIVLLCLSVFSNAKKIFGVLALAAIAVSAWLLPMSCQAGQHQFFHMLVNDTFSIFFRHVILLIAALVVLLSMGSRTEEDCGEYYFFILTVTCAMMLGVASNNLMMMYLVLEAVSLISYLLAGYHKQDVYSSEAGMKYFIFGALSTGITLYGISLIYGMFGTLNLAGIFSQLSWVGVHPPGLFFISILLLVGFGFKCSLVPFHMWTPDVYQGAPTPVAAFLSVGPKAMGFAFLLRTFFPGLPWFLFAGTIAILTMTIGNITAIKQTYVKRLLAYSTIAHAGYIFLGLAIGSVAGWTAALFYIFVYVLMNLGAFAAVVAASNAVKCEQIEDFAGLYKRDPFTAIAFAVLLLSLAGIPPLAGFLAKFFILAAAVEAHCVTLAIVLVINSVVALYYYAKIIKFMFFVEPKDTPYVAKPLALNLVLAITAIGNIIIGIWPHFLMNWLVGLLQY